MAAVANFVLIFVFLGCIPGFLCYDTEDYEIFDLVEEVNRNFYDLFDIKRDATTSEIKKSYRRLAVQYHPDKNKEEDASERFRQIAAVYEVLKDEKKRQKYDVVLEVGLPDWKQPVYYYRQVRKLGLVELAIILTLILTVGHFLVLWASYFEKKFEMEEVFRSRQKKERKVRGRQKQNQEAKEMEFEEQLQEHLEAVPKPRLLDLVPFRFVGLVWYLLVCIVCTPKWIKEWREQREEERKLEQQALLEEQERKEEMKKYLEAQRSRKKKVVDLAELRAEMMAVEGRTAPVVYGMDLDADTDASQLQLDLEPNTKEGERWSDEELTKLAKAVAKFPGGTAKRWQKISQMVGRTVKEVIFMSKNMQQEVTRSVDPSAQGITGASNAKMVQDTVMTHTDWMDDSKSTPSNDLDPDSAVISAGNAAVRRRRGQRSNLSRDDPSSAEQANSNAPCAPAFMRNSQHNIVNNTVSSSQGVPVKGNSVPSTVHCDSLPHNSNHKIATNPAEVNSIGSHDGTQSWSPPQQRILEQALVSIPKGTSDRWGKISEQIPGKTKEECIARYKYLADVVKKRKAQKT